MMNERAQAQWNERDEVEWLQYTVQPPAGMLKGAYYLAEMEFGMLETIRQDYIRTARAKGVKEHVVIVKHALRNAMIPITTTVGLQFGFALGGAVLVETVFAWPGIGRLLVDCIKLRDTPVVTAVVLVIAALFAVINLGTDVLYAYFDPRIKAQYKAKG